MILRFKSKSQLPTQCLTSEALKNRCVVHLKPETCGVRHEVLKNLQGMLYVNGANKNSCKKTEYKH